MTSRAAHVVALALVFSFPVAGRTQQRDISGTWELTDPPGQRVFERVRPQTAGACDDPDEAQIRLLRLYSQPARRFIVKQDDSTLVITGGDGSPNTFHPDGRDAKLALGRAEVTYRARWTTDGVLVIEWKPSFGGTIVESYTPPGSQPLLQLDVTIEHRALSQPSRQRLTYRRVAETVNPGVPAAGRPAAAVGQVADTDFRPVIDRPAYKPEAGPVVLLDEAHANFHTISGRYAPFADLLRRDGYVVKGSANPFTAESLRGAAVLVIANARETITAAEVAAVRAWVTGGGSLLLITDHPPNVEAAMDLGRAFGISFRNTGAAGPDGGLLVFRRSDGTLKDHPITRGIEEVVTFAGSSFQVPAAGQPLLTFGPLVCSYTNAFDPKPLPLKGHLQGAVLEVGAGRVAVFGEAAMFSAQVSGPNRSPMGMNMPAAKQNAQFLLNVMHWLTRRM